MHTAAAENNGRADRVAALSGRRFIEARPSRWPGRCRWRVVVPWRAPLRDAAISFDQRLRAGLSESETGQLEALLIRLRDNVS